jgi:LysR family hydrogen peroxide-inducible transcriptional activator
MNLRELEYLVAVGEHRHFGRAAEACHVSQPTLSTQIKRLETELGVTLIERNPRQILLTPVGEQVAATARGLLAQASEIRAIARHSQDPEAGSVRMGLFPTLAPYLLPHVVPALQERFPKLELLLVEEKTEVVLQRLRDGRLDVGLVALPVPDAQLHAEPLFVEEFLLAVPTDHPLADEPGPIDTATLAHQQVLLLEEGHCLRDQALEVCRLAGASERMGFRATSLETLRQMVSAGVGVTLLPRLAVLPPVPTSRALRYLELADPVPSREIAMTWRRSTVQDALLGAIADVIGTTTRALLARS